MCIVWGEDMRFYFSLKKLLIFLWKNCYTYIIEAGDDKNNYIMKLYKFRIIKLPRQTPNIFETN